MGNDLYNTYKNVIEKIKNNNNTLSIILVGSSKDKDLRIDKTVNDIDLFIIVKKQEKDQIRELKVINNIEFDLNYISLKGCENFIKHKEYFFLKIYEGKLIYDVENSGKKVMYLCEKTYKEGPNKIPLEEKKLKKEQLISDISRLKEKDNYLDFEYDFLIYMYLSKVIKSYYLLNDKWLPKDKKLIKSLKKDDEYMYNLSCEITGENKYDKLMNLVNYSLKNI